MSSLCTTIYLKDVWYEDDTCENPEIAAVENRFNQLLNQPPQQSDRTKNVNNIAKFPGFVTSYNDEPLHFKRSNIIDKSFNWYRCIRSRGKIERYITTFLLGNELRVLIGEIFGSFKNRPYITLSIEMWERLSSDYVGYMVREAIAQLSGSRYWIPDKRSTVKWNPCTDGVYRMYLGENKWLVVIKECGLIHVCIRKFYYSTLLGKNYSGHGINFSVEDWRNVHLSGTILNVKLERANMITFL